MAGLDVNVVSTDRTEWSGKAKLVVAPAADGEIGILAGHVPVLSVLRPGRVRIHPADGTPVVQYRVDAGYLSVDEDVVTIAVDTAELSVADTH